MTDETNRIGSEETFVVTEPVKKKRVKIHSYNAVSRNIWGLILIWAGGVFMARNLGLLNWIDFNRVGYMGVWSLIIIGAGVLVLLEAGIKMLMPSYKRSVLGTVIVGLLLIIWGTGGIINWNIVLGAALVVLGLTILLKRR